MLSWEMLVLCAHAFLTVCIAKLMHVKNLYLAVEYNCSIE